MTPHLFASPDIAALVASFPPPIPTKDQSFLVRSYSGNTLLNSTKVLTRFRDLLETSPSRINTKDLPRRLGIENADWLLEYDHERLSYSRLGQSLIPAPEIEQLAQTLQSRARQEFVDLNKFAVENDLTTHCLDAALSNRGVEIISIDKNRVFLATASLLAQPRSTISNAISNANSEKIDLTALLPDVPNDVLLTLAVEARARLPAQSDGIIDPQDGRVVYVPPNWRRAQVAKQRAEYQRRVLGFVENLEAAGWCEMGSDEKVAEDVSAAYTAKYGKVGEELEVLRTDDGTCVVVRKSVLDDLMEELKADVRLLTPESLDAATETALLRNPTKPDLARHILQTAQYRTELEAILADAKVAAEADKQTQFSQLFRITLLAPTALYAAGLASVPDEALKQRIDEYLADYSRIDITPAFQKQARAQGLLEGGRARTKDVEKLAQSLTSTKTFADAQSAINKVAKKQRIDPPSQNDLHRHKLETLGRKVSEMKSMTRPSDVLQNLTWILLAERLDGLFVSAGKDTTRMIKFYRSVGGSGVAEKLERWRDGLKAGTVGEEEVKGMVGMAEDAVGGMG